MTVLPFSFVFLASVTICFAGTLRIPKENYEENTKKLAKANNELALNLYRHLSSGSSENIFFSPFSLSTAFGMLYYGTKGKTAEELRNALGYEAANLPEELVHEIFQHYLTDLLPSQDPDTYVLNSANAALLDRNMHFTDSYKKDVQNLYQAKVRDVDFLTQGRQIVQEINDWIKDKTNGKIEKLLDGLDPSTIFVLLNAVYFKGTWKTKFDSSLTHPHEFYNNGLQSEAKEVPMMWLLEQFPYTTSYVHNVEALEMPYKGENISMIILLPHERDGLEAFEKSLSLENLNAIRRQLNKTDVYLTLPKFKVEYSREMSDDMKSLGAKSIFAPGADFSGMTSSKNVFVTQVFHKAVVEVTEEGSEASAVTEILTNGIDTTPEFIVDHPFLFAIIDKRNDMVLFVGRVTNL